MGKTAINFGQVFEVTFWCGLAGAVSLGLYSALSAYDRDDNELNIIVNEGLIQKIDAEDSGVDVAWGWNDEIMTLPGNPIKIELDDSELTLVSAEGDRFSGEILFKYQFQYQEGDGVNEASISQYQNLHEHFGELETGGSDWHYVHKSDIHPFFVQHFEEAAKRVFLTVRSEDFYLAAQDVSSQIIEEFNKDISNYNFPVEAVDVELGAVEISRVAEQRIGSQNVNAVLSRNPDNHEGITIADFSENTSVFYETMRTKGFEDAAITELFCLYLNDTASREGRDMDMDCIRADVLTPDAN